MSQDTERKERRKKITSCIKKGVGAWEEILELC